jgi:hypothetical protein
MCFNAEASLSMFVIGTLLNLITAWIFRKKPLVLALCVFLESVIIIQLWEYIMWKNPPEKDENDKPVSCNVKNQWATKAGFVTHLLQPVIMFVSLACLSEVPVKMKIAGAVCTLGYLAYMGYTFAAKPFEPCTGCVKEHCESLVHPWWKVKSISPYPYILIFGILSILMIRPWVISGSFIAWTYITLAIAISTWNNPNHLSSRWCFLAALGPIMLALSAKVAYKGSILKGIQKVGDANGKIQV